MFGLPRWAKKSYQFMDYSIFFADSVVFLIFLPSRNYLTSKHIDTPFSEKIQRDISDALIYFAQTVTSYLLSPAENTKMGHSSLFYGHNSGNKHDN